MYRRGIVARPAVREANVLLSRTAGRAAASAVSLSAKADTKRKERLLWLFVRLCRCLSPNGAGADDESQRPHGHREEALAGSGDRYVSGPPRGRSQARLSREGYQVG